MESLGIACGGFCFAPEVPSVVFLCLPGDGFGTEHLDGLHPQRRGCLEGKPRGDNGDNNYLDPCGSQGQTRSPHQVTSANACVFFVWLVIFWGSQKENTHNTKNRRLVNTTFPCSGLPSLASLLEDYVRSGINRLSKNRFPRKKRDKPRVIPQA